MLTINLEPDIAEEIDQRAHEANLTPAAYVDAALRAYLAELRWDKIGVEQDAFEKQKPELLSKYRGEYIAMHEGQVIDHDSSAGTLHKRVFARLGHTPVLLKQVIDEPDRDLVIRSPRLEPA